MTHRAAAAVVLLAGACLAGCKEDKPATPSPAAAGTMPGANAAQAAVESAIATAVKGKPRFRGETAWLQAIPGKLAICGQVAPFGDDGRVFVPFVAVATLNPGSPPSYDIDQRVGTDPAEATRVYAALTNYCFDRGGPAPGPSPGVASTPPLPNNVRPPQEAATPEPAAATPATVPPTGNATMRQAANLHSDPKGPSLRVIPSGTALKIFGQAPGGWLQVGDTAPWGWVHESMLNRR